MDNNDSEVKRSDIAYKRCIPESREVRKTEYFVRPFGDTPDTVFYFDTLERASDWCDRFTSWYDWLLENGTPDQLDLCSMDTEKWKQLVVGITYKDQRENYEEPPPPPKHTKRARCFRCGTVLTEANRAGVACVECFNGKR